MLSLAVGLTRSLCVSLEQPEITAITTVRKLFENSDWQLWASLDQLLPLLAEAAPEEFLDSVESELKDSDKSLFRHLFDQGGGGNFGEAHYICGLLWALEALAWNPHFLSRVSLILSDLASIDPGGNILNRPSNSLVDIFLPWHVQTCAPLDKRIAAVKAIIREHPEVGWRLILALLPKSYDSTSGCNQPTWRNYIPSNWKDQVSIQEYWEQIDIFTELAINIAKTSIEKLTELTCHLVDLPEPSQEILLGYLASYEVTSLPDSERLVIWEKLGALVRKHRRSAGTEWAMPEAKLFKIENCGKFIGS